MRPAVTAAQSPVSAETKLIEGVDLSLLFQPGFGRKVQVFGYAGAERKFRTVDVRIRRAGGHVVLDAYLWREYFAPDRLLEVRVWRSGRAEPVLSVTRPMSPRNFPVRFPLRKLPSGRYQAAVLLGDEVLAEGLVEIGSACPSRSAAPATAYVWLCERQ